MKLRKYFPLVLLVLLLCTVFGLAAQDQSIPLVNNQYIRGQYVTGTVKRLIGLNTSNAVSIDPDGVGTVFGGTTTYTGAQAVTGAGTYTGTVTSGVSGTTAGAFILNNATSGTISLAPTTGALGTVTATFPAANITVPGAVFTSCTTSLSCAAPATTSSTVKVAYGNASLSSASPSTASVSGISPAFGATSTMFCTATPVGTTAAIAAAGLAINITSTSAFTVTGPNTVTTNFNWTCIGT